MSTGRSKTYMYNSALSLHSQLVQTGNVIQLIVLLLCVYYCALRTWSSARGTSCTSKTLLMTHCRHHQAQFASILTTHCYHHKGCVVFFFFFFCFHRETGSEYFRRLTLTPLCFQKREILTNKLNIREWTFKC